MPRYDAWKKPSSPSTLEATIGMAADICGAHQKLRSHDTSRIAWAKLMARVSICPWFSENGEP
jgi:hypothetical protein